MILTGDIFSPVAKVAKTFFFTLHLTVWQCINFCKKGGKNLFEAALVPLC
jgi:hypothetical protein